MANIFKLVTHIDGKPIGDKNESEKPAGYHKKASEYRKKQMAKKMSQGEAFKEWAKRANYDPKHKRDSNSPAGVYQGKGSHFAIAGKHYEEKKGSHWK